MGQITDVVKHLLIINILMYLGTQLMGEPARHVFEQLVMEESTSLTLWGRNQLALFYPTSPFFRPFQLVTHMFMHGSTMHIFFNMFALYMFGPPLEALWGKNKFLFYYFFTGFGALALHMLVMYFEFSTGSVPDYNRNIPMLGASGAVFGLLAGFGMKYPNTKLMLIFPPIPMKAKYFVLIYAAIELFLGMSSLQTGVAHFAHLGGALFGFLIILFWQKNPKTL